MSDLDVSLALSARYKTSAEADGYTERLRQSLGLDTKAQVARLAIGRSLGMGKLTSGPVDSGGKDIPASSMFSPENIGAWIGLLVTHGSVNDGPFVDSLDSLRAAIRAHWHRGAVALWEDWKACEGGYDRFIEALVRRSEMPDFAEKRAADDRPAEVLMTKPVDKAKDVSTLLSKALDELGIKVQVKDFIEGPRITRYRVLLMNLGDLAKLNRSVPQLSLALSLGDTVVTVSNGDEPKTVFVDVPRPKSTWQNVGIDRLRDWAQLENKDPNSLLLYAGVDVTGADVVFDLVSAPHLLVGGTTNSGKSVCLHSFILSLLLRFKNSDSLQLALIDPKQVEFAPYSKLPNLYGGEIITEVSRSREVLSELVAEMDSRYAAFNRLGVVNIAEARRKGQRLASIVVFIEEMADLVMQDDNIEPLIARLAQKARAAGIHLILATQRPDSATFSGLIRSNIPARVALTVRTGSESKIILDEVGAEHLLGRGDMLLRMAGSSAIRAHGVFVQQEDIGRLIS